MKKGIHPTYNAEVQVQCICGNTFAVSSAAKGPIKVETCPACHSTYTGTKERLVSKGRMEKFEEKMKRIQSLKK